MAASPAPVCRRQTRADGRAAVPGRSAMNWPTAADYRDALQNLARALRPAELHACKVEANRMGVPQARSGSAAIVYKLLDPDGSATALKLFTRPEPERAERYRAVADHLA